jgi:hypothetical protein
MLLIFLKVQVDMSRLERLAMDNNSSLLGTFVNYEGKMFL